MSKRGLPAWRAPAGSERPVLKLFNSLTRKKEVFVPERGDHVSWYSCGPTVYDASHMGHARTYISFDILRRILSNYFGYRILYVMNITDIDDKIIRRARQNHLFEKYEAEERSLEQTLSDATSVMGYYESVVRTTTDPDKRNMMENMLSNVAKAVEQLKIAVKESNQSSISEAKTHLLKAAKDPFSEWLDHQHGSSVTENKIFTSLPRYWEKEFHSDMKALNVTEIENKACILTVDCGDFSYRNSPMLLEGQDLFKILPPDVLTRVSEYVPQIVAYIERIIKNGLAYESNGSVYFDVGEFDKREKHHYARLVPEAYGDTRSLQEGEGDLSDESGEKRSPNDFALWKRSKSGEPWWESPWGAGRPGWHIECSAMASDVCGAKLDIHTGGVDLKFPHHDNELAQSEAHFDSPGWVNYFLHTGHLTIAGCKMSKSLKNFISVKEALRRHTATQLRLAFLLHSWRDTLDYSDNTMEMALQTEKLFSEFFLTVKDAIRCGYGEGEGGSWGPHESTLQARLSEQQDLVHLALCDNIDTRTALAALRDLVAATHVYLRGKQGAPRTPAAPSAPLLGAVARYVTDILHVMGAVEGPRGGIGWGTGAGADTEEKVMPYLEAVAEFRHKVRDAARAVGAQEVLALCDRLRDDVLPELGVRLEDKGERSVVKLVCGEALRREREEAARAAAAREERRREQLEAQRARDELRRVPPADMFRAHTDKYSLFDDKGLPTHDHEGVELSKGLVKKLQKLQLAQEKKYKEYLASAADAATAP